MWKNSIKAMVFSICILFLVVVEANAQAVQAGRIITVTGKAEQSYVPDEAHVVVNLSAMDMKLSEAKAEHDKKLKKLMKIVGKAGIAEQKIKTQSSNIQPIYRYEMKKRIFDGYRVNSSLDVTVGDTLVLGDLLDDITNAGFEEGTDVKWGNLMSMYYTFSDPDKIRDEMLADAIANARKKADFMAEAAGAEISRVYQISEGSMPHFSRPVPIMADRMMKSGIAEMASVAPPAGEQELQVNVTVSYELED